MTTTATCMTASNGCRFANEIALHLNTIESIARKGSFSKEEAKGALSALRKARGLFIDFVHKRLEVSCPHMLEDSGVRIRQLNTAKINNAFAVIQRAFDLVEENIFPHSRFGHGKRLKLPAKSLEYFYDALKGTNLKKKQLSDEGGHSTVYTLKNGNVLKESREDCDLKWEQYFYLFLDHPNLLTPLAFSGRDIVLEKADHDLKSCYSTNKCGHHTLSTMKKFLEETAGALTYLHSVGVIHMDVKGSNILISIREDGIPFAKLGDFSVSAPQDAVDGYYGALKYQAPEVDVKNPKTITSKVDAYSYGIVGDIVAQALTREGFPNRQTYRGITQIFKDCMAPSPSDRPSMEAICKRLESIKL